MGGGKKGGGKEGTVECGKVASKAALFPPTTLISGPVAKTEKPKLKLVKK